MRVLVFGEALWDVFPDGKKLGGAPVNFAAHLSRLGAGASILTAVGGDPLGRECVREVGALGIDTAFVSVADGKRTGVCAVTLANGEPSYELVADAAYDYITAKEGLFGQQFDALYFGTLARRSAVSEDTLRGVLANCRFQEVFCDLNLRQNFYTEETIRACLRSATILKLNRSECETLVNLRIAKPFASYQRLCEALCGAFSVKIIVITLDSEGAVCYCRDRRELYRSRAVEPVEFVSAVGAGDGFSACFLYHYMNGVPLQDCVDRANALGAYIVGFPEAIPQYSGAIRNRAGN
ncbi:MAG: PfkB family carbohydrate kinase [Clostridiales bacterium]|jgi:fructokinase|nr:PfkB family carbohydrate kinase [Clostridiales bacterium]